MADENSHTESGHAEALPPELTTEAVAQAAHLFEDFDEYWQTLVQRNPAMDSDLGARVRGLNFGDFRMALRDSFNAARATYLKQQS